MFKNHFDFHCNTIVSNHCNSALGLAREIYIPTHLYNNIYVTYYITLFTILSKILILDLPLTTHYTTH